MRMRRPIESWASAMRGIARAPTKTAWASRCGTRRASSRWARNSRAIRSAAISLIDSGYARDRTSAYHGHIETDTPNRGPHPVVRTLRGADTPALRVLGRGYASDAKHVWYQGAPVLHADAPSFAVVDDVASDTDARDRTGSWKQGRKAAAATR